MIGDLDEPAEMDLIPDVAMPDPIGPLPEARQPIFPVLAKPAYDLLSIRALLAFFRSSSPSPPGARCRYDLIRQALAIY
jgi:hypothetical protein